jgi:hypothetical protein
MDQNAKDDLERFRDTERKREKERQIRYQQGLGPVKTSRELEIERLDRLEEIWKGTTRGY